MAVKLQAGKAGAGQRAAWKQRAQDSARIDALLDAAAAEFNARGVAGASLTHIAQCVQIKRAALYYYFDSREDLAHRCYLRACAITAADIDAAQRARNGLARLLSYLRRTLDARRAPAVVLSEIAYLDPARRVEVQAAHNANLRRLQSFIEDGIADGSVRDCDARVVAQAIFGMASWVALAGEWVLGTGEEVRQHAAQEIADMVERGVAKDPDYPFRCTLDAASFGFQPGNAFDRRAAAEQKIELMLRTASGMFNRRGIDGTSLDDITAALGATKGAFYQYFPEKRDLVVRCVERAMSLFETFAGAAEAHGKNGLERAFIGLHLNAQAQASRLAPLSPLTGLEALPARALKRERERSSAVEARFERMGHAGIADGSLRPYHVRTLALAGAGAFGWIPKWLDDDAAHSARDVADQIVSLFLRGLRRK